MIDWVSCQLPCLHTPLQSGLVCKIEPDGSLAWSAPCRVEVTGSHEAGIQIRSSGGDGQGTATHLSFSGNPSKFLQGHNIFGSDDLLSLMLDTYTSLIQTLGLEPSKDDWQDVEQGRYRVTRVDINYSFELSSRADVLSWLRAAEYTSKTRHGRPSSKGGTLYWGKTSKRWALKGYSKGEEITAPKHRLPDLLQDTPLPDWADNKLRLELVLRSKELDDINLSQAAGWTPDKAQSIYNDYIARLDMAQQITLNSKQLKALPHKLRSTYIVWESGNDPRQILPKTTYYRHRKQLLDFGINIDLLQSTAQHNVVPLVRVLEAQPADIPDWAYDLGLIHHSAQRSAKRAA